MARSYPIESTQRRTERSEPLMLSEARDLVALVPGFLGFERLGGFGYFADQMAATIRAALEQATRRRTPVVPLTTFPAGSLVKRQKSMIDQLTRYAESYRPERIHLVTHSSGGLDAYFLTADKMLTGAHWSPLQQAVRARVASIVTMGAPFLGTTLSDSEVAQFLGGGTLTPPPLREVLGLSSGLVHLFWENEASLERLAAVSSGLPAALGLIRQLTRHRELIGELSPKRMMERYQSLHRDLSPKLTCFVSYVPPPKSRDSSPLFRRMYGYTAQGADKPAGADDAQRNRGLLERVPVLGARCGEPIQLDLASSDGVVNTLRQLPPNVRAEQVAALVVADHADLLGYFDRVDPATGRQRNLSIFRSGATFRDDQFFQLFATVAQALL